MDVLLARLDCLRYTLVAAQACSVNGVGGNTETPLVAAKDALRACFKEASELMLSYFPDYADP